MLTLDELGGAASGVEVRPECIDGLPPSGGCSRLPNRRKPLPPRPQGRHPSPNVGMGSVHLGNVGQDDRALVGGFFGHPAVAYVKEALRW